MKEKKKLTLWERYLTKEIGIEFKACLYFFSMLVYYCCYRLLCGKYEANILHMAELIFLNYCMGYIQVYFMNNFDEADHLGFKEIVYLIICSLIYGITAYFANWFDKNLPVTAGFFGWVVFMYVCCFLLYKWRRKIDDKTLNSDLKIFQTRIQNQIEDDEE